MYISRYMIREPLTATPDMSLPEARRLLNENHFRHLPVVDGQGQLVGMITDRDLRSAYPSSMLSESERLLVYKRVEKTMVVDIMSTECIALTPESTLDDALLLFDREGVGALPVLEDGHLVGIFSSRDLLTAYKELFGVGEKGSVLLGIDDDGQSGLMTRIVTLLELHNIPFTRLLRIHDAEHGNRIYLRLNTCKIASVIVLLREAGIHPAL
ncbi:MAG: CBS domain-containing protein [Proteobacteria bacterium]|nr:CBS domain-containing protein [Pseudomonadota bacterium]MCG2745193.1 CBS domain-containing protein [Desulfobacteraceae bacterium]MDO8948298.1 CBS domain-containing protein [Desulfocapsaceae bacterium]MBU4326864.1 CBS domain-containing protein [Pseudomonadota bacterium]MBU4393948.1 CBS domain-containing protein [Pseudomonadota bacterium]